MRVRGRLTRSIAAEDVQFKASFEEAGKDAEVK